MRGTSWSSRVTELTWSFLREITVTQESHDLVSLVRDGWQS